MSLPAAADRPDPVLLDELSPRCTFPPAGTAVVCAVSGGPDSTALLALAVHAGCAVTAVHVDHGLRPDSEAEAAVVAGLAARLGARFRAQRVVVEPGPNLQARARAARYAVLPADACTGHTADDQAETIVLALVRGAGWAGLGAMTPGARRPILGLRRTETAALCAALEIEPLHDPTNADPTHRRSRVRHEVLPLLSDVAGRDVVPVLVRQAELFRGGGDLIEAAAAEIDPTDAKALTAAPPLLARTAVRRWLTTSSACGHPPDLASVDRVLAVARLEVAATEVAGGRRVVRHRQRLVIERP